MSRDAAPVAVLSGGSSGIGLAVARILRASGFNLVLLARDAARLEDARQNLLASPGGTVAVKALDVADAAASTLAIAQIVAEHGAIDWLVTSAGLVEPGMFLDQPLETHHQQMQVNYFGTLNLVRPVAAGMKARGQGTIILVSSAAAFTGIVGYSGYCPSKAAVKALGEVLHTELAPSGIKVCVAFPPDTDTPQLAAEQLTKPEATRRITAGGGVLSADAVATAIVEGARRGDLVLAPGRLMKLFSWFHSLYSPFFLRRQARILAQVRREGKNG